MRRSIFTCIAWFTLSGIFGALIAHAQSSDTPASVTKLPEIIVSEDHPDLLGSADSASEGSIGADAIHDRPIARPGEVLEAIPGMIITQHSGGGKANQYYLRGFNLDHGTDFAGYVDGVPINLPSHAHGQGYMDLNGLIPELVENVTYEKGVYYADQGDFANAGSTDIEYYKILPKDLALVSIGGLGYERGLVAASSKLGYGNLLYSFEAQHYDGASETKEDYRRFNGVIRYSEGDDRKGFSLSGQAYSGTWLATDQIPQRLIDEGADRYTTLDPSSGGNTERFSLYGEIHHRDDDSASKVTFYLTQYSLDLFSDFTYFLNQTTGDQIEQRDKRIYTGTRAEHTLYGKLFGMDMENMFGVQIRQDWVTDTLNQTDNRVVVTHDRTDEVSELNLATYYQNKMQWTSWLRSTEGLRADAFHFSDTSDIQGDSGDKLTGTVNPKLTIVFGPWAKTEFYLQGGFGFRTNDARGVFSIAGPGAGSVSRELPAIVHTQGAEVGVRSHPVDGLNTTVAFWSLWSQSDTFFDGDSGSIVDADRPGVRYGVEWTNFYSPTHWLALDADFSVSRAYFTDNDPLGVGKYIPEAVTSVISAGLTVHDVPGIEKAFASLRLREFGPRPLVEDDSQKSQPSTIFNLEAGYHINSTWTASVEVLNLFNTDYNDNEYYYSSRLKGEVAGTDDGGGMNDHMVHPGEPRSLRATLMAQF